MQTPSSSDILYRLKQALSLTTDTELSVCLGIKKATVSNWRNRNSLDWGLIFTVCEHVNIDWLVTGRGEMLLPNLESPCTCSSEQKNLQPENFLLTMIRERDATIRDQAEEIGRLKEQLAQLSTRAEKNANDAQTLMPAPAS